MFEKKDLCTHYYTKLQPMCHGAMYITKKGRRQISGYNRVAHLTQDTTWENDKKTHKNKMRANRPAFSQQVTTRLQETDKTVWQKQTQITKKGPQKKHRIGTACKNLMITGWSRLYSAALWSLTGKGLTSWLLFVMFNCVFVTFPCGILGQVRYLIVSIPDFLCKHGSLYQHIMMWIKTHRCMVCMKAL